MRFFFASAFYHYAKSLELNILQKMTKLLSLTLYCDLLILAILALYWAKKNNAMGFHTTPKQIWIKSLVQCTRPSYSSILMPKGNFYFLRRRIFIFCSSEALGINIQEYEGLVHCTRLFIQICFGVVCSHCINEESNKSEQGVDWPITWWKNLV